MVTKDTKQDSKTVETKTYIGEISIKRWQLEFYITTSKITIMGETFDWLNGKILHVQF